MRGGTVTSAGSHDNGVGGMTACTGHYRPEKGHQLGLAGSSGRSRRSVPRGRSSRGKASCTKIRRQEPARKMLAEGTEGRGRGWGDPPQTTKGPGCQAIGHRESSTQEKSSTCMRRLDGTGLEAEAGQEITPWTDTRDLVSLKGGLMPSHLFSPPTP